ncbi:MAG: DUF222 domain-containing protein, partial [Mycobacterium sp.]
MFDESGCGGVSAGGAPGAALADDAVLIAAITAAPRAEAVDAAHRFDAIADLIELRAQDHKSVLNREYWWADCWASVSAEVAAAAQLTRRAASNQMRIAMALRHRLPQVAALHRQGRISTKVVSMVTFR